MGFPYEIHADDYYDCNLPYDTKVRDFHKDRDKMMFIAEAMGNGKSLEWALNHFPGKKD